MSDYDARTGVPRRRPRHPPRPRGVGRGVPARKRERPRGASDAKRDRADRPRLGGTLGRTDDTLALLVCADDRRVGFVYLVRERPNDDTYRRAELAYWVTPDEQGNGYATDAAETALAHGFDRLGLHKVTAKAFASNDASRRVLEKLGFVREGVFREEAFVDGTFLDVVRYGLLADEWRERDA